MQNASVALGSSFVPGVRLGKGGMGYIELGGRVERERFRWLARKRMHPELRQDPDLRTMFKDEGRLGVLIQHPNIVRVFEVGEDGLGPFMTMEYVEGLPLSALLRRAFRTGARPPIHVALRICRDIAVGLHAAHELRAPDGRWLELVHRDVSPSNILIGFDGSVRLIDFGIAKALDSTGETCPGVVKGTRGYLSPEQLRADRIDRRSDLFSLGVVLYELLTGARLYGNQSDGDARRRILTEPPPRLGDIDSTLSEPLADLTARLLAKDPAARPSTALEVATALESMIPLSLQGASSAQVATYVTHHFAQRRTRIRALLAELRQQIESGTPGPQETVTAFVSGTATTRRALPPVPSRSRLPLVTTAALVVVMAFALVAGRRPITGTAGHSSPVALATGPRTPEVVPLPVKPPLAPHARPHKRRGTTHEKRFSLQAR